MASPFVHLHVHSEYSLLDGACRVDELARRAKELGQPAVALTDHGNLFGVIDFYQAARKEGVQPIIGYEAYIAPGSRTVKEPGQGPRDAGYHMVLLARDLEGYGHLLKLATTAYLDGFYYRPRIDNEILRELSGGLILLTSCLAGQVPSLLGAGHYEEAVRVAKFYRDLVGPENFFLELQNHGLEDELRVMPLLADVAKEVGVGLAATNDVHYLRADDWRAHDALLCISTGKVISDENRMKYPQGEFHLRSAEEMAERFSSYPEALENTLRIAERCNLDLSFKERHAPVYVPPEGRTDAQYLRELCEKGLAERYGQVTAELRERMDRELRVIEEKNFSSYFLIVWDFVNFARQNRIPCGARGSGVGALVTYVLGLCDVDPLRWGLLFERFMDPSRNEMPDIDMDMCQDGRARVIEYVRNKYGAANVAQIITFGTMAARAVVRDVGRVMGIPLSEVDALAKKIPAELNMTLDRALEVEPQLRELCRTDPRIKDLIDIARRLEGMSRHASVHAAGVVIGDAPLVNYVPLCLQGEDVTTQWAMGVVEKIGLLKMDFLGLRTLSILQRAVDLAKANHGAEVDLERVPLDDPKVFELFGRGETKCVFQFESPGMRDLLQKMKPDQFTDLIAANSLYRPGPMEMIGDYIERKHGRAKYEFPHKVLHEVLDETYGCMAYQEQVMQILNRLGNLPLPRAYKLIKAISKKDRELIETEAQNFAAGCRTKKIPDKVVEEIWQTICRFGGYGFNKSHSTRYAKIAYQTAYMKAHFPVEFMAAQLTYDMVTTDKVVEEIAECQRMGIEVRPPDVNESDTVFTVAAGRIRFGLAAVKGVGERAVEAIRAARATGGPFRSVFDFAERVDLRLVNRAVLESLIECGAFDFCGARRSQMLAVVDRCLAQGSRAQEDARSGQSSLFGGAPGGDEGDRDLDKKALPDIPEFPPNVLLGKEKEVLGFFVSASPLAQYANLLRRYSKTTTAGLVEKGDGSPVVIGGLVTGRRERLTKQGKKMAVITLQDLDGSIECVAFEEALKTCDEQLKEDRVVFIVGEVSRKWEQPSVRVGQVYAASEAIEKLTADIHISLGQRGLEDETLSALRDLLKNRPGKTPVHIELTTPAGAHAVIKVGDSLHVGPDAALVSDIDNLLGEGHLILVGGSGPVVPVKKRWNGNGKKNGNGYGRLK